MTKKQTERLIFFERLRICLQIICERKTRCQPKVNLKIVAKVLGAKKMTAEEATEFCRKHNIPYRPGKK